jgi:hypothetical protein
MDEKVFIIKFYIYFQLIFLKVLKGMILIDQIIEHVQEIINHYE